MHMYQLWNLNERDQSLNFRLQGEIMFGIVLSLSGLTLNPLGKLLSEGFKFNLLINLISTKG